MKTNFRKKFCLISYDIAFIIWPASSVNRQVRYICMDVCTYVVPVMILFIAESLSRHHQYVYIACTFPAVRQRFGYLFVFRVFELVWPCQYAASANVSHACQRRREERERERAYFSSFLCSTDILIHMSNENVK